MATRYRNNQITFKIEGFTPATLPSARLGQYLIDLNALLGSGTKVQFQKLAKGSTQIIQWAEVAVIPEIRKRLASVKAETNGNAPDLTEAYDRLNRRLIEDNSAGKLKIGNEKILDFPGGRTDLRRIIGPVTQSEYLDGQLFRIGGFDATIPVHLKEGDDFHYCTANIEVARKLAPYLYGQTLRLFGIAYWYRYPNGHWRMDRFRIENFEPLKDVPLREAVERLRSIPNEDWDENISDEVNLRKKVNK